MTKIVSVATIYLVTPKAGAKHELLFNKPAASSHRGSMFLGYAENTNSIDIYGQHFADLFIDTNDIKQIPR